MRVCEVDAQPTNRAIAASIVYSVFEAFAATVACAVVACVLTAVAASLLYVLQLFPRSVLIEASAVVDKFPEFIEAHAKVDGIDANADVEISEFIIEAHAMVDNIEANAEVEKFPEFIEAHAQVDKFEGNAQGDNFPAATATATNLEVWLRTDFTPPASVAGKSARSTSGVAIAVCGSAAAGAFAAASASSTQALEGLPRAKRRRKTRTADPDAQLAVPGGTWTASVDTMQPEGGRKWKGKPNRRQWECSACGWIHGRNTSSCPWCSGEQQLSDSEWAEADKLPPSGPGSTTTHVDLAAALSASHIALQNVFATLDASNPDMDSFRASVASASEQVQLKQAAIAPPEPPQSNQAQGNQRRLSDVPEVWMTASQMYQRWRTWTSQTSGQKPLPPGSLHMNVLSSPRQRANTS